MGTLVKAIAFHLATNHDQIDHDFHENAVFKESSKKNRQHAVGCFSVFTVLHWRDRQTGIYCLIESHLLCQQEYTRPIKFHPCVYCHSKY